MLSSIPWQIFPQALQVGHFPDFKIIADKIKIYFIALVIVQFTYLSCICQKPLYVGIYQFI